MNNYNNPIIDRLPNHLKQYIVAQHYEHYTAVDHAVWRYVMRQNYNYLKDVAYYPYIPGLKKAGLTIEHIPDLQTMNDHLKKIGWGAVTVNGFIPSQAFMEFQAYRVLIIAADIRQIEHIEYTPAPDIIHESAGHAPIIGEPEYAAYLQFTGEVGTKAMLTKKDQELFEAIRRLAVLKELAGTPEKDIQQAEEELAYIQQNMGAPSEMALLARLHWWTVEYGLIGTPEAYKIYGAGLLSSIGESVSCMRPEVKKIAYTLDAVNYAYDITKPQPQLFVTPDFQNLVQVLDAFAATLAYRKGGVYGLEKAIACGLLCTAVYSSGLQVSGIFVESGVGDGAYITTAGPTALAIEGRQLEGHDKNVHGQGFGSPVGKLRDYDLPLEDFTAGDLKNAGIETGSTAELLFRNGIQVRGTVEDILIRNNKIMLIRFSACMVIDRITARQLFQPEWGFYDMAVGAEIVSVFSGASDKDAYEQITTVPREMPRSVYSGKTRTLHELYQQVRNIREEKTGTAPLADLVKILEDQYPEDWLCLLEVLEILKDRKETPLLQEHIRQLLLQRQEEHPGFKKLIDDGLHTLKQIEILPGTVPGS
ncbi:aromatic amino acid hydroxylase [Niabella beijingensis]|uniref:aromatic amino acid hydroxylase n=1 Tax=Niabella beijingensis TaxID=2872700 RepID=UPI001CBC4558|nr:aromatic amino acid hydroxylase [Niabella beijingensis]MBZ4191269.1 aromatic amino acid hydroxylase [Niabella beijingensis]